MEKLKFYSIDADFKHAGQQFYNGERRILSDFAPDDVEALSKAGFVTRTEEERHEPVSKYRGTGSPVAAELPDTTLDVHDVRHVSRSNLV